MLATVVSAMTNDATLGNNPPLGLGYNDHETKQVDQATTAMARRQCHSHGQSPAVHFRSANAYLSLARSRAHCRRGFRGRQPKLPESLAPEPPLVKLTAIQRMPTRWHRSCGSVQRVPFSLLVLPPSQAIPGPQQLRHTGRPRSDGT